MHENKNNVFIKEKKHILDNKNETLIAAMKVLHFVMNIHDEDVKNLQIAGDQVSRVIFNFIYLLFLSYFLFRTMHYYSSTFPFI